MNDRSTWPAPLQSTDADTVAAGLKEFHATYPGNEALIGVDRDTLWESWEGELYQRAKRSIKLLRDGGIDILYNKEPGERQLAMAYTLNQPQYHAGIFYQICVTIGDGFDDSEAAGLRDAVQGILQAQGLAAVVTLNGKIVVVPREYSYKKTTPPFSAAGLLICMAEESASNNAPYNEPCYGWEAHQLLYVANKYDIPITQTLVLCSTASPFTPSDAEQYGDFIFATKAQSYKSNYVHRWQTLRDWLAAGGNFDECLEWNPIDEGELISWTSAAAWLQTGYTPETARAWMAVYGIHAPTDALAIEQAGYTLEQYKAMSGLLGYLHGNNSAPIAAIDELRKDFTVEELVRIGDAGHHRFHLKHIGTCLDNFDGDRSEALEWVCCGINLDHIVRWKKAGYDPQVLHTWHEYLGRTLLLKDMATIRKLEREGVDPAQSEDWETLPREVQYYTREWAQNSIKRSQVDEWVAVCEAEGIPFRRLSPDSMEEWRKAYPQLDDRQRLILSNGFTSPGALQQGLEALETADVELALLV